MNTSYYRPLVPLLCLGSLVFTSCQHQVHFLDMEDSYQEGAIKQEVADLNTSPYETNVLQEDSVEQKATEKKGHFTGTALEEFSNEGLTRQGSTVHHQISGNWWHGDTNRQLLGQSNPTRISLDATYVTAIANSTQIKVFGNIPIIRETGIEEARGAFDPEVYSSMSLGRIHEPVGTTLQAGGDARFFSEREWEWESGIRKRLRTGAQVNLAQGHSRTENNSQFSIPRNQGRGDLTLRVTQPLLRGAGMRYNESVIRIAKLDHEIGTQEFIRQIETHLTEVNRSYWALYLARSIYNEKKKIVDETSRIVDEIGGRGSLDTMASQRARAEAALASRQADLIRSELSIKNAESRLRALLNDPRFVCDKIGEIIPCDRPVTTEVCISYEDAIATAIKNRPEVLQAEGNLQAANIRERMAKQDRLPELNAFGETSIGDLHGRGDWWGATGGEFSDSHPSWSVGLSVSQPLNHRLPKAQHLRSEVEFRQQQQRLKSTMETIQLEVLVAYREVTTAYPDMLAKHKAALAAQKDLQVMEQRRNIDGDGESKLASVYLENLIEAQGRLVSAREEFLQAMIVYNVALTNFERAKGTLIRSEGINFEKDVDDRGLPELKLTKECPTAKPVLMATPVCCNRPSIFRKE